MRADQRHSEVITHLEFPRTDAIYFLHLRFQVSSKNLQPGKQIWDDGRCLIEWHPPSGGLEWESDPFCSVRYDHTGEVLELVMRPEDPPAIPALRFENLGVHGDLEISVLEATVMRERMVWKVGRWILMAAWVGWLMASINYHGKHKLFRSLAASFIMLLMGLYFVVPGPWKCYRALGTSFKSTMKSPESRIFQHRI